MQLLGADPQAYKPGMAVRHIVTDVVSFACGDSD